MTIALYCPAAVGTGQEFDKDCGSTVGVRFIFTQAINAKYFFAYDPNPQNQNIMHATPYFVAANGITMGSGSEDDPTPVDTSSNTGNNPGQGNGNGTGNNSGTADFALVPVAVLAVAAAGIVVVSRKRR